ncbi:MAG: TonB-dependent receptor [Bryobacterales bacterium]|nr:TonB-dependent receptor [Bryobacterales bacterium]
MRPRRSWAVEFAFLFTSLPAAAQSLGGAGTLRGIVSDPAGASIPSAQVELSNPVTGFSQETQAQPNGAFAINNIPPNRYRLRVSLSGFQPFNASVLIRTAVPPTPLIGSFWRLCLLFRPIPD